MVSHRLVVRAGAFLVGLVFFLAWPQVGRATGPDIRVGISVDVPQVTVSSTGAVTVRQGNQVVASPSSASTILVRRTAQGLEVMVNGTVVSSAAGVVSLIPGSGQHLRVNQVTYRGRMEVHPGTPNNVVLVNILPLEQYLYGVVPAEMPSTWPLEALKAQAVAARTYAVSQLASPARPGVFDLFATVVNQVYGGLSRETVRSNQAVDETRGEILVHGGQPVRAVYHSSSGGHTENSSIVWGGSFSYLTGVPDFDQESPHYSWTVAWTPEDLGALFQRAGHLVGTVTALRPAGIQGVSGRWTHYDVVGQLRTVRVTANDLRAILGLRSTLFEIQTGMAAAGPVTQVFANYRTAFVFAANKRWVAQTPSSYHVVGAEGIVQPVNWPTVLSAYSVPNAIAFVGRGWGHGVGMSQWGARGMALMGNNYRQILAHYYRGAVLIRN